MLRASYIITYILWHDLYILTLCSVCSSQSKRTTSSHQHVKPGNKMYINIPCKKTQPLSTPMRHSFPRISKITVTRNSILYRRPVIKKPAHFPTVFKHLLLSQNDMVEGRLTIQSRTHKPQNHHLRK